ncbi:MAG: sialidase family protein [Phycisphaerae bacterium]
MNSLSFARRTRLRHALLCLMLVAVCAPAVFGETGPAFKLVGKEVFIAGRPGVRVVAQTFYVRSRGQEMISRHFEQTKSDKADIAYQRFSQDNGRTWSAPAMLVTNERVSEATRRRAMKPGFVDPTRDVLVTMFQEAILPTDHPLEGMKHWTLHYALSRDGGRTNYHEGRIVHKGMEYSPKHPLPNVWVGKNSAMIGDTTCVPIRIRTGEILQPIQITPIGPDGEYHNPGGGYTYHDSAVLIGRWNDSGTLDWELSNLVKGDPTRSTRGMLEPTIIEVPDGRILMVLRGSNDCKPNLPGYRWYAVSSDHGRSWSPPKPWTYDDGESFYSPSSCSQLLRHSSGQIC